MFSTTDNEIAMYDLLVDKYPKGQPHILDLIAWCAINRPERLMEILEQHKNDDENEMIDLADLDITKLYKSPPVIADADD